MFIFSAKITKSKLLAAGGVLAGGILLCALICVAAAKGPSSAPAASVKNIKTNDDRIAYLATFGWDVVSEPLSTREVTIPAEFDNVYQRYNELQKSQGFDLLGYSGKVVKRYTYGIANYPTGETSVVANIITYKNEIIAADICSTVKDGFMHGVDRGGHE